MAHFLGEVTGTRGKASRLGTKKSGITVKAMGWGGMIQVDLIHNELTGRDLFTIWQHKHPTGGAGIDGTEPIAEGVIGQPVKKESINAELLDALKAAAVWIDQTREAETTGEGQEAKSILEYVHSVIKEAEEA